MRKTGSCIHKLDIKQVPRGCWSKGCTFKPDVDFHGQDLKVLPRSRVCLACGPQIAFLLSANHVVLLASSSDDPQHALWRFAAECEVAGMRISTSKFQAMVPCPKNCFLWVGVVCWPTQWSSSTSGSSSQVTERMDGLFSVRCVAVIVPVCCGEEVVRNVAIDLRLIN